MVAGGGGSGDNTAYGGLAHEVYTGIAEEIHEPL